MAVAMAAAATPRRAEAGAQQAPVVAAVRLRLHPTPLLMRAGPAPGGRELRSRIALNTLAVAGSDHLGTPKLAALQGRAMGPCWWLRGPPWVGPWHVAVCEDGHGRPAAEGAQLQLQRRGRYEVHGDAGGCYQTQQQRLLQQKTARLDYH
mgnify:CR=1 FL=1